MLAMESRNSNDYRTIGGFFYLLCDEVNDIRLSEALLLIFSVFKDVLSSYSVISEEMAEGI